MIIIGAGLAGLSAGCYAQMNGYESKIFETLDKPGGVCTAWTRKGYTFDYSIHNLGGTSPQSPLRKLWDELGALPSSVISFDEFVTVETPEGKAFHLYADPDRLEQHMKELAPGDEELIDQYVRSIRRFGKADLFAVPMGGLMAKARMLPLIPLMGKWSKLELREFATKFSDPFLRKIFPTLQYDIPEVPVIVNLIFAGGISQGDLGFPVGGSLQFSRNIEKRFLSLGGVIQYRSKVTKILVKENKAVGVRLADGSEHFADLVISAADGRSTIFDMLDGAYTNQLIRDYYEKWWPKEQEFGLQASLGVERDVSEEPHSLVLFLAKPIIVEGRERDRLDVEIFSPKTGLVTSGRGVIKVVMKSNYSYWKMLREDKEKYDLEKKQLAEEVIDRLEKRFPGLRKQVEVVDVSTLVTAERYVGTFHGLQAWGAKEQMKRVSREGLSRTLPGLHNFYMAGQWADATVGIFTAAISGRNAIRLICKEDGRKFTTK